MYGDHYLGRLVKERWNSEVYEIVLQELGRAGSLPRMRLTGLLGGMNMMLPSAKACRVTYLDGDGNLGPSLEVVRRYLRASRARKYVLGAINDPISRGALRAFQGPGLA